MRDRYLPPCHHDRFLIIDDKVYLCGASIKDLGSRWFSINLMEYSDADALLARLSQEETEGAE